MIEDAPLVDMSTVDVTAFDHEDEAVSAALQRILKDVAGGGDGVLSAFQSALTFGSAI